MLKQFKKDIDALDEETMDESDQSIQGNQVQGRMSRMNIECENSGGRMSRMNSLAEPAGGKASVSSSKATPNKQQAT